MLFSCSVYQFENLIWLIFYLTKQGSGIVSYFLKNDVCVFVKRKDENKLHF